MKWITSNTARLVLSTGIIIHILVFVDEDNDGREISFAVHQFPVFDDICQVAWENEAGVLLGTDGKVVLFKWDLTQEHEITRFESFPNVLPTINSKRVERRLTLNENGTEFAIWWSGGGSDVFPWSPKLEQRANVLVYSTVSAHADERPHLIFHKKTDGNLFSVQFAPASDEGESTLITLEDFNASDKSVISEIKETKYNLKSAARISETSIPLQSQLKCHAYDQSKKKLCLGLCNCTILICSEDHKLTRSTKAAFVPCHLAWNENSLAVLVVGPIGQIQLFDIALNPLFFKDHIDRYTPTLTTQLEPHGPILHAHWGHSEGQASKAFVLLGFESGNISVLDLCTGRMKLTDLVSRHLEASPSAYAEAIRILRAVQWNGDICRIAFHLIFSALRVEEYSEEIEQHFENLFESYFIPTIEPFDPVWAAHRERIQVRAQSYHHWLFLAGKYKRSLEVAAMIDDEGCIRKVYFGARRNGAVEVATEAERILNERKMNVGNRKYSGSRKKHISSDSSSTAKDISWCSTCNSSSESYESEHDDEKINSKQNERYTHERSPSSAVSLEPIAQNSSYEVDSSKITIVPLGDV